MTSIIAMAQPGGNPITTIIPLLLVVLIFYFMILRPQQKKQKERTQLLESVQKGDKVITVGGVHGTVVGLEDKTAIIQIADNVKVKYERSAISTISRSTEAVGKTS